MRNPGRGYELRQFKTTTGNANKNKSVNKNNKTLNEKHNTNSILNKPRHFKVASTLNDSMKEKELFGGLLNKKKNRNVIFADKKKNNTNVSYTIDENELNRSKKDIDYSKKNIFKKDKEKTSKKFDSKTSNINLKDEYKRASASHSKKKVKKENTQENLKKNKKDKKTNNKVENDPEESYNSNSSMIKIMKNIDLEELPFYEGDVEPDNVSTKNIYETVENLLKLYKKKGYTCVKKGGTYFKFVKGPNIHYVDIMRLFDGSFYYNITK